MARSVASRVRRQYNGCTDFVSKRVTIVGGGLAGCEAAWQLARRGVPVVLHEMRPVRGTPVHQTADFAELVCSNSLRGNSLDQAAGLLKEEMRRLGSLVVRVADEVKVPGGAPWPWTVASSPAASRRPSRPCPGSRRTGRGAAHPRRPGHRGHGTSDLDALARDIAAFVGATHLYFYDAVSPVVEADSID